MSAKTQRLNQLLSMSFDQRCQEQNSSRQVKELAPSCRGILRGVTGVEAAPAQGSLKAGPKGRLEMSGVLIER